MPVRRLALPPRFAMALIALPMVALAACSSPEDVAQKTGVAPSASASATATTVAKAVNAKAVSTKESTELFEYELSYPAKAAAIPPLAARIEEQAAKAKAELMAQARDGQKEARSSGFPFNPYSYSAEWQVVADIPGYLSLSNATSNYTGGAHGMYGLESYVWDKQNGRQLETMDMFVSPAVLKAKLGSALCAALDKERAKRRGEPVDKSDTTFSGCPGLDESTVLVGSAGKRKFDRITVYFGPYVAGAYAEGPYELDFPMSRAMLEAVKPAYREAFSAGR
jgi:hypothetical protein